MKVALLAAMFTTSGYAAGRIGIAAGAMRDAGPHSEQAAEDPGVAGQQPLGCFEVRNPSECGDAGQ